MVHFTHSQVSAYPSSGVNSNQNGLEQRENIPQHGFKIYITKKIIWFLLMKQSFKRYEAV